jgi:glycosyltransferase involved in cell wall biosynthesis
MDVVENGLEDNESAEHTWFAFVDRLANGVLATTGYQLLDRFLTGRVLDVFSGVGRAGALYSLLSPYFVTYGMAAAERELGKDIAAEFVADTSGASPAEREVRVGHFTDTYYEVNGVARTLQQWADSASRLQKALTIITCHENPPETYVNTQSFRPVTAYELPEYPEIRFLFPPILQMLGHCADQGYTHIHAATPGPIGLAALCIARILRRPCFGTYHTALPQYTDVLTDDSTMGRLMWQYMVWFYEQMDVVFVNSQASADELIDQGVSEHRLRIIPRGVDTDRFHPDAGKDLLAERFDVPDCTRLLYVGRISREKDLPLLVSAFRDLVASRENLHLVIVGDGPYREEMEAALAGLPATFTGYLDGDDLAAVYAESDLFVFPSTTDTFGNVVLEAQAAGIPVIVSDIGGPCENLLPEKTGRIVPAGDAERFAHAIAGIVDTPGKLDQMKAACRPYGESRSFDAAFSRMWDLYDACEQDVQRPARERRAEERVRASAPFAPPFARPTPEPVG